MQNRVKVVFLGDIIGKPGRQVCKALLPEIISEYSPDAVIANGENLASGFGISKRVAEELLESGVSVFTGGNHSLHVSGAEEWFEKEQRVLIPANFTKYIKGSRIAEIKTENSFIYVFCLVGRLFMNQSDNPFTVAGSVLEEIKRRKKVLNPVIVVDFHAEATSEKKALFYELDGKATAVFGTHTHVATSDEFVSENGTAYITDAGMAGAFDSVIGMGASESLESLKTGRKMRLKPAFGAKRRLDGVFFAADSETGKALEIKRFTKFAEFSSIANGARIGN
ncbi:YmdB family metallophosphoesterase [candidate division WOR-3 bacterium]|nr:YmdB family metallophosphoesterase [candidate division WOR-3 bacterium]